MKNKIAYIGVMTFLSQFLFAQTIYYSKSTGNLNATATWGTSPTGTGTSPSNFTSNNCVYIVSNNTAPTINGNWTVSGTNSYVKVGDGTQTINFTVPNTRSIAGTFSVAPSSTLTAASGSTVSSSTVNASGVFNDQTNNNPAFGTLASGSTVIYSRGGNQTVVNAAYANLTMSGSGTKTVATTTNTSVSGVLTINTGVVLRLANNNSFTFTLSGTITGSGTIRGGANSILYITGTGNVGTLTFSTALNLYKFTMDRAGGGIVTLGSALTVANAFTHTNGIINLNGKTLTLNGTVTFPASATNGSFTGSSTSSLSFGAGGASGSYTNSMYMTQSGTSNYLNNITLNNTSSPTLTLGNALNLVGALTPTAGTFASGGNLTLIASSSTNVARIGTIGTSGNVTGNVTVQMYAKGGTTGWTTMGSPGLTGRTFADWDDNITIQCLNCPDGYYYNFTSVQWYDETAGGVFGNTARYKVITNTTDPMTIGKGYWVYLGTSTNTTTDLLLDATGPVNKGNYVFTITLTNSGGGTNTTDHGYNLITNPYPSPINWTSLRAGNASIGTTFYVYNPDISGYATYNSTGAVSNPAAGSGGIGNLIPAGQSFFVKASAATTLTALETYKSASTQALLRGGNNHHITSSSNPMVLRLFADGNSMHNETAMYFDAGATTAFEDEYDGAYMGVDPGKLGIATSIAGNDYSINGLPELNQNLSIPVKVTTGTGGTYQISAHELQNLPGGACVMLHDNYTNNDQDLRSGAYSCTISDTETVARFVLNITINSNLQVSGLANNPGCSTSANGSIIAYATGSAGPWNYYWKDANNNIIKTSFNKAGPDTLQNVSGGNYSVDINTSGTCDNGSQSFILQGSQSANASFNPSVTNTTLVADTAAVSFTNTSTNASTYLWDFGDGNSSTDTNALNIYNAPGIYTVTLTAYNALCGDSSVTTQVVIVDSASILTAIANNTVVPHKNMFISKDEGGYFVQFNFKEKTNAVISLENVLGEKVLNDLSEKNAFDQKVYIPLGNAGNKILILSVVTEAGDKAFLKIVNP
ncbi:MAG: beta strand repeat-containing protein [Bacteroidia bacterium]